MEKAQRKKESILNRREFLGAAAAAALTACRTTASQQSTRRPPNIVLIMADDMGYECLGCYGSASYETPRLDELAATGVRFTQAHSQPLCTPSRVKIMTGRGNWRNYDAFGYLPKGEITFAHMLKDAGYATCVAGKWQLHGRHDQWVGKGARPEDAGFDEYCLWQIKERGERYADPLIKRAGEPLKTYEGAYGPDMFRDYINNFMEQHRDEPFFVYFPMCLTHNPFVPTPDSPEWETDRGKEHARFFADMVAYTDKLVGQIADKLEELGLREDTLFIFTGDNGTHQKIKSRMQDGRTVRGGKGLSTDAGTHVPLVVNWPGKTPRGAVCNDLIGFDDFMPTFADATGAQVPRDRPIDGVSFLPQILGRPGDPRDWLTCHYDPQWGGREPATFAFDHHWKLYRDGRFYNIANDILEERPIPEGEGGPGAEAARQKLQRALATIKK